MMRRHSTRHQTSWVPLPRPVKRDVWFGTSIDGFRKSKPVLHIREWLGFDLDLDVPLPYQGHIPPKKEVNQ